LTVINALYSFIFLIPVIKWLSRLYHSLARVYLSLARALFPDGGTPPLNASIQYGDYSSLHLHFVLFLTQSGGCVRFSRLVGHLDVILATNILPLRNLYSFLTLVPRSPLPYRFSRSPAIIVTVLVTPQSLWCVYRLNSESNTAV